MKVLELFSGVGGMRVGLAQSAPTPLEFVAVDLNQGCNEIYKESFGDTPLPLDICSLSLDWFIQLGAKLWTMSPPCQPYTRQGNQKDMQDDRAKPLIHICHIIETIPEHGLPACIIVENVKNFELSDSFIELKRVLQIRGYALSGYLVNPLYMGFPNSRLRFFLVAIRKKNIEKSEFQILSLEEEVGERKSVADFLCSTDHDHVHDVPLSILTKRAAFCFDIVALQSVQSLCFTRAYTKFIDGTGSVLYTGAELEGMTWDDKSRPIFKNVKCMSELSRSLRYFCPREAARLNGFGTTLCIPCDGGKRYYRAIGNSLNPQVVARLVDIHSEEIFSSV